MSDPFIYWRRGKAYFRRRVPTELVTIIGKTEWLISLKTADKRLARQRALEALVTTETEIAVARRKLSGAPLPDEEIRKLADLHFDHDFGDTRRLLARSSSITPVDVLSMRLAQLKSLQQCQEIGDTTLVQPFADAFFVQQGLATQDRETGVVNVDRHREDYQKLCRELLAQQIEAVKRSVVEASKAHTGISEPAVRTVFVPAPANKEVDELAPGAELSPTELYERFEREHFDGKGHNPFKRIAVALALLEQAAGKKPIASYTGKDIVILHDQLMRCPAKHKAHFGADCTMQKAIEENAKLPAPLPTHAIDTINRHLSGIRTFYKWAQMRRLALVSPAQGFKPTVSKSSKRQKETREAFDTEELQQVFAWIHAKEGTRAHRFWLPYLALYTGGRLAELCQLAVADVREKDGLAWIEITNRGEGQSVKSAAGRRIVPLHADLIALGFLTYWRERQSAGDRQLFPSAPRGAEGRNPYNPVSQWFTRLLGKAGVRRPGLSFHSFRHTWNEAARQSGIPKDMREALLGHANGTVNDEYGGTFGLEARANAMRIWKIEFKGPGEAGPATAHQ